MSILFLLIWTIGCVLSFRSIVQTTIDADDNCMRTEAFLFAACILVPCWPLFWPLRLLYLYGKGSNMLLTSEEKEYEKEKELKAAQAALRAAEQTIRDFDQRMGNGNRTD